MVALNVHERVTVPCHSPLLVHAVMEQLHIVGVAVVEYEYI